MSFPSLTVVAMQLNALRITFRRRLSLFLPVTCLVFATLMFATFSYAGDWPQVLGPTRNAVAINETLAANWQDEKPTKLWEVSVGEGYAGPAVRDDRVCIFHRVNGDERLDCYDAISKKKLWSTRWKSGYGGGIDSDRGPRCVPIITGDRVLVFGAGGDLHCVQFEDGAKLWSRSLAKQFKAKDGYFGFGSTPIVSGENVLVNVGGDRANAGIVALNLQDGELRWSKLADQASYSSPIPWKKESQDGVIFVTRMNLLGLRPTDGRILFQVPFGARGPTVNASSPVLLADGCVFVTASYRIGAKCFDLTGVDDESTKPKLIWESDSALSSQYPTPVYDSGFLYGVHGREDGAAGSLRCIDAKTGEVRWSQDGVGMAHVVKADGKLLVMTTEGQLSLVKLSPERFAELGKVSIADTTTRALPALSNGRLFVKDVSGRLTAWKIP